MSLSKPFLKETKTNSLFCLSLQSCPSSSDWALTGHRDLSPLSDLSRDGARAGMTTGATLSGPSLASWFLDRKLGEGYKDTLDQSDWCLMFLCN